MLAHFLNFSHCLEAVQLLSSLWLLYGACNFSAASGGARRHNIGTFVDESRGKKHLPWSIMSAKSSERAPNLSPSCLLCSTNFKVL